MSSGKLEGLMVVFKIETVVSARGIKLGNATFDKLKAIGGITAPIALHTILQTLEKLGIKSEFTDHGKPMNIDTFYRSVTAGGKWGHIIDCGGLAFHFARVTGSEYAFVQIKETEVGACKSWDTWVEAYASMEGFCQAWVSNTEYEYWQNAQQLSEYKYGGRDASKLPLISNGLPPPLLQDIVDISRNPGRRIIRKGHFEAVGATMWLSKTFFDLTKGAQNLDEVRKADWLTVTALNDDVIKVQAHPTPFSDESTAAIQDKTRALLYPL
jgi:hypothetical protein